MKKILLILPLVLVLNVLYGQRLLDRSGEVQFYSEAPLENIEAINKQALGVIDITSQKVAASLLMKGFRFEKALMEEHFNENYVESDKYPKATFSGTLAEPFNIEKDGSSEIRVTGDLTLHGVTNPVECIVRFEIKGTDINAKTSFMVKVEDYEIKIPKVVIENIAEKILVTVTFDFKKP